MHYVTKGFEKYLTMSMVARLRDKIRIGDKVNAEIPKVDSVDTGEMGWRVQKVTILAKYPHIALTNRGSVMWTNIAIHNRDLVEEANQRDLRWTT